MANEKILKKLDAGDMKNVDGGYKYVIESKRVFNADGSLGDEEGLYIDFYSDDANLENADFYETNFEEKRALTLPVIDKASGRFYKLSEVDNNANVIDKVIRDGLKILGK